MLVVLLIAAVSCTVAVGGEDGGESHIPHRRGEAANAELLSSTVSWTAATLPLSAVATALAGPPCVPSLCRCSPVAVAPPVGRVMA